MICIVYPFPTDQTQSHAFGYNGQLQTLHAEVYFLYCRFPILRFLKFHYRKGIIKLIISHCEVQSSEGEKTVTMRTDTQHRLRTVNSYYTPCNKQRKTKQLASTSVASQTTGSKHYAKCEKQISLWQVRNMRKIKKKKNFQHCTDRITKV